MENTIYKDWTTGKWHGIRANARALRVNPSHLLRVVRGERTSKRLIERLRASGALVVRAGGGHAGRVTLPGGGFIETALPRESAVTRDA